MTAIPARMIPVVIMNVSIAIIRIRVMTGMPVRKTTYAGAGYARVTR